MYPSSFRMFAMATFKRLLGMITTLWPIIEALRTRVSISPIGSETLIRHTPLHPVTKHEVPSFRESPSSGGTTQSPFCGGKDTLEIYEMAVVYQLDFTTPGS